jgi:hypothetical protein
MFFHSDIFEYGDVLLWRHFVAETLCYWRRPYVTGDIMSLRHPVMETFCKEMICQGDILDILYVRLKEESAVVKEETCEGQESNNTSEDDSFR